MKKEQHPYFAASVFPRIVAHRGLVTAEMAAAGIVENSSAAIAKAVTAGAYAVESDCHATKDGVAVLVHDPDMRRVAGDKRKVCDLTLAQMRSIMADRGGLLTVSEALEAHPQTRFQLDVKAGAAANPAGRAIAFAGDRVLLTSFSENRRKRARAAAVATLAAASKKRDTVLPAQAPGRAALAAMWAAARAGLPTPRLTGLLQQFDALQIPTTYLGLTVFSQKLLALVQPLGIEVHVWTINDVAQMRRLFAAGADGVITDCADVALRAFNS